MYSKDFLKRLLLVSGLAVTNPACQQQSLDTATWTVLERQPGERAPLSAPCDQQDQTRCLLPWPSDTFTVADPGTATGLRLDLHEDSMLVEDDPSFTNLADGFSRITGVSTAFHASLDADSLGVDALRLLVAEPQDPRYGESIALQQEIISTEGDLSPDDLLVGRPLEPLPANAEHVVLVTRSLRADDGQVLEPSRETLLILGLEQPANQDEADLLGYHAPTRSLLEQVGVDPQDILRVWTFTTRSRDDPTRRLLAMNEVMTAQAAGLSVDLDQVEIPSSGSIAAIVGGWLRDVPSFLGDDGNLSLDSDGMPVQTGTHDVELRLVLPAGSSDYHVAMYGHGTGGTLDDDSFDEELASEGIAKFNLQWQGWTETTLISTLADFTALMSGVAHSTAGLLQSLADGVAVLGALDGQLGDALAAATIAGETNPAAGRRPDTSLPVWVGGSQGGTMGAVFSAASSSIGHAVLNVPGCAWSHMIPGSYTDESYLHSILGSVYEEELDISLGLTMSQVAWDDVDGSSWADLSLDDGDIYLLQESMEDPILPNIGTNILAAAEGAVQVDPSLDDILDLEHDRGPIMARTAIEQFRVPDTGVYDVHGFAARDTLAGEAAREQILEFLDSVWAGQPQISHPDTCTENTSDGSCDFSGMW